MTSNPTDEPVAVRYVDDVETLRLLSDPTRLAIVQLLMEGAARQVKVRTVKELAHELEEPQTKLYRHIKQLQAAGLIQVADTRLVSGIVESSYRTGQLALRIDERFLAGTAPVDDTLQVLGTMLDRYRDDLFDGIRAGRVNFDGSAAGPGPVKPTLAFLNATVPAGQAVSFADRLAALVAEFAALPADPAGVPVHMLVSYYAAPEEPALEEAAAEETVPEEPVPEEPAAAAGAGGPGRK